VRRAGANSKLPQYKSTYTYRNTHTASSALVRRAGANSKLAQLELLRASLQAKSVSEFNALPKFVELSETMLRTYQGVNYHADALGKVVLLVYQALTY
jgi:hypothetical protein